MSDYNFPGFIEIAEQAAKAYDKAAIKYHGEYALTNQELKERKEIQ